MKRIKKLSASFPEFFLYLEFHNLKSGIVGHFDTAKLKKKRELDCLIKFFKLFKNTFFDFRFKYF